MPRHSHSGVPRVARLCSLLLNQFVSYDLEVRERKESALNEAQNRTSRLSIPRLAVS